MIQVEDTYWGLRGRVPEFHGYHRSIKSFDIGYEGVVSSRRLKRGQLCARQDTLAWNFEGRGHDSR